MKIVIAGGSGQVGSILSRKFHKEGHTVVVLSRSPQPQAWCTELWDGASFGGWVGELERADVLINLTGFSVNCRYNEKNRRAIKNSRVYPTRLLGEALRHVAHPPALWVQASTATIYAHRFDAPNDERTGILGGSEPDVPEKWMFSIDVARAWEDAFDRVALAKIRKVTLRSAVILSPDPGGIFDTILRLVRFGLGGKQGSGCQYVSWVHHEDFTKAVCWLINHAWIEGIVNIASPNPLPNQQFMKDLRTAWGAPVGLASSGWMLEIGAALLKTETELLLKSRRVVPGRLSEAGFEFEYPVWKDAARDLCDGWRAANQHG